MIWDPYFCIVFATIIPVVLAEVSTSPGFGHYRCSWVTAPAPTVTPSEIDESSCSTHDSQRLASYISHCTNQQFTFLSACDDNETWSCNNFISICKTLIRMEPAQKLSPATKQTPAQKAKTSLNADPKRLTFDANEKYFTMKEMAIAVLVSFITGAIVLVLVICVVWRCRNSRKLTTEQMRDAAHQRAKRCAALHAITHIAHAFGVIPDQPGITSSNSFNNPHYGQIINSKNLLDEVLSEHDRVYEEIFSRRKSSCTNPECVYDNIDVYRKGSSLRQSRSAGDLKTINELAEESDVGYEADTNNTPQPPRRKKHSSGSVVYSIPRSNAMHVCGLNRLGPFFKECQYAIPFKNNLGNIANVSEIKIDNVVDIDEGEKSKDNKCESHNIADIVKLESETTCINMRDSGFSDSEKAVDVSVVTKEQSRL